ncbi:MAG: hypothetical protein JOY71_20565 [Acetobacteraceae bacterium]|nr:hypothetical protein [Acetobacteraceae bacterium]
MAHDIDRELARRPDPVTGEGWDRFWDRLHGANLAPGEAAQVLTSLSASISDEGTLYNFINSLQTRRSRDVNPGLGGAVNIVGTGGGPSTFNISTAAAFVAAAMGVRVVKTGSRAYSSRCGSIDLLQYLRIPLTTSHGETEAVLERFGIAFAGYYVYPRELTLLAKAIMPVPMKAFGRLLNIAGPFLAETPAAAQLTGVSDTTLLPKLKQLSVRLGDRDIWLCSNGIGADELISFTDNEIFCNGTSKSFSISPRSLGLSSGSLDELAPAATREGIPGQFRAILSGDGPSVATDTVCLNAAAVAILSGAGITWPEAVRHARAAIDRGHALRLVDELRRREPARKAL